MCLSPVYRSFAYAQRAEAAEGRVAEVSSSRPQQLAAQP